MGRLEASVHDERVFIDPNEDTQVLNPTDEIELREVGLVPVRAHSFLPEQYFVEYRVN